MSGSSTPGTAKPGTMVMLRHGESVWNRLNLFTGWRDVLLTDIGRGEAEAAGRMMAAEGLRFDVVHTSLLTRAVVTAHHALDAMDMVWLPVERSWRLNERHYGTLQGLDKKATSEQYGAEQTHLWRRSYDVPPPPVDLDSPEHPRSDPRYARLPLDVLPATECLRDVVARVLPYWFDVIAPQIGAGLDVLVVAHGNSLRALMMYLERITPEEIAEINIPTGAPRAYRFDDDLHVTSAEYLGDPAVIAARAAAVAAQSSVGATGEEAATDANAPQAGIGAPPAQQGPHSN